MTPEEFLDSITVQPEAPTPFHKRAWAKFKAFMVNFPKWFGLYLGICGLIFFNLFIFEEAQQQIIFSTWSSKSAGEWRLIKGTLPLLQKINKTSTTINDCFGWINPIGYLAYSAYNKAEIEQIKSLTALVFANAPELFDGEKVEFSFIHSEMEVEGGYYIFKNGNVSVLALDEKLPRVMTGKVSVIEGKVVIDTRRR